MRRRELPTSTVFFLGISYTDGLISPFTQYTHLNLGKLSFPGCITTSVERSSFCTSCSRLGEAVMAEQVRLWLSFCRSLLPFKSEFTSILLLVSFSLGLLVNSKSVCLFGNPSKTSNHQSFHITF